MPPARTITGPRVRTVELLAGCTLGLVACAGPTAGDAGDGTEAADTTESGATATSSTTTTAGTSSATGGTSMSGGTTTTSTTGPVDPPPGGPFCIHDPVPPDQDRFPPEVELLYPRDGAVIPSNTDLTISGTASDDGCVDGVTLYADDIPTLELYESPLEWPVLSLPAGTYTFWLVAVDSAGNETTSNTITISAQ